MPLLVVSVRVISEEGREIQTVNDNRPYKIVVKLDSGRNSWNSPSGNSLTSTEKGVNIRHDTARQE